MTLKAAIILVGLLLLAGMIGRSLAPRVERRKGRAVEAARKCPVCETYVLTDAACARADCPRD